MSLPIDTYPSLMALYLLLGHYVKDNGYQQDKALDRFLPVGVDAKDGHTIVEDTHEDGSNDSPTYGPYSTIG